MLKINRRQRTPVILAVLLIIVGVVILALAILHLLNLKLILSGTFALITCFNLVSYLITYKDRDLESILTAVVSLINLCLVLVLNLHKYINVALIIIIWTAFVALIRLKKADYYNDQQHKIWIVQMVTLFLFILTGLLTAINLAHPVVVQTIVIGYFFLINGILELIDPLVLYLGFPK